MIYEEYVPLPENGIDFIPPKQDHVIIAKNEKDGNRKTVSQ